MQDYFISVDIGTQGTKAALFDGQFRLLHMSFEKSHLISPEPGTVWQEADDIFLSCARTIKELMEVSGADPKRIAAIGIDGQMAGIMGIGWDGEATTYYDSWLDTRSGAYVEEMEARCGKSVIEISGGPATYNHGSKILWWKNEMPHVYKKTAKFVLPHGYVIGKMTGLGGEQAFFDYTCLHFSSFGDNKNKIWSEELLSEFGVETDKMARIVSPFEMVGRTTQAFAGISGLISGIPVVAGLGDTSASTFGSGMFERDMIQDCAGTASVLCAVVDSYVPDVENKTLTMMRSPIDGLWLPLAYINGGGLCVRWFRDNFSGTPNAEYGKLEQEAALIPPGSERLIFIPHFSGRILPSDASLKGAYLGLNYNHTRAHLYKAIMESIAYEYSYYLSVLKSNFPDNRFDEMLIIGGGANSPLFNQIKADVLGIRAATFHTGETALLGSAVVAAAGVGFISDYRAPIRDVMLQTKAYTPDMGRHKIYGEYAKTYMEAIMWTGKIYRGGIFQR